LEINRDTTKGVVLTLVHSSQLSGTRENITNPLKKSSLYHLRCSGNLVRKVHWISA